MCGIAGILGSPDRAQARAAMARMLAAIAHRGPDGEGHWQAEDVPVTLGHRRLAIIDVKHGAQPMVSADAQLVLVHNGEIYNFLELRRELTARGHEFETYSDTEVLLHAYQEWGEDCLAKLNGMFAFAIWDGRRRRLFCARDRFGMKPFYYFLAGGRLVFASEIKAIMAEGGARAQLDRRGLADYLTFQVGLHDKTLFHGVHKLEPGCYLSAGFEADGRVEVRTGRYWDIEFRHGEPRSEAEYVERLAGLLEDSIGLHMRSDVPLGAYLSGGLDSSAVAALVAGKMDGFPLKVFTGRFADGPEFDESPYARLLADHIGADYHEVLVDLDDLETLLPRLIHLMDEPAAGPGLIPQFAVSQMAAQSVKVVLGGQGGDEVFIGYARYVVAYLEECLRGAISGTANPDRFAVSLQGIAPNLAVLKQYEPMLREFWQKGLFEPREQRYRALVERGGDVAALIHPEAVDPHYDTGEAFQSIFFARDIPSYVGAMTYFDTKTSLTGILQVEDRMSMGAGLESRLPFLDHRIVEAMAQIPTNIKFADGKLKHLLKQAVRGVVPRPILERKDKMGFPVPLARWATGRGRDFIRELLLSQRARERGLFRPEAVEAMLAQRNPYGRGLWGLICLELWHRQFVDA